MREALGSSPRFSTCVLLCGSDPPFCDRVSVMLLKKESIMIIHEILLPKKAMIQDRQAIILMWFHGIFGQDIVDTLLIAIRGTTRVRQVRQDQDRGCVVHVDF